VACSCSRLSGTFASFTVAIFRAHVISLSLSQSLSLSLSLSVSQFTTGAIHISFHRKKKKKKKKKIYHGKQKMATAKELTPFSAEALAKASLEATVVIGACDIAHVAARALITALHSQVSLYTPL
jgi:hypothetical protein